VALCSLSGVSCSTAFSRRLLPRAGFVQPKFQSSRAPWRVALVYPGVLPWCTLVYPGVPWCTAPYRYQKLLLTLPRGPDPVHCVHVERLVSLLFEEPEQFFSMVATYHG
jgi:hypothetical protein